MHQLWEFGVRVGTVSRRAATPPCSSLGVTHGPPRIIRGACEAERPSRNDHGQQRESYHSEWLTKDMWARIKGHLATVAGREVTAAAQAWAASWSVVENKNTTFTCRGNETMNYDQSSKEAPA